MKWLIHMYIFTNIFLFDTELKRMSMKRLDYTET